MIFFCFLKILQHSCDEIIRRQIEFEQTYNHLRKSIESLHDQYQTSLESDSGVAELSALLSKCDSLRDDLDLMNSSFNTIDSHLQTRRSSFSSTLVLSSSSIHSHTMKSMLQQTKDEYDRLVQTLRSSKQSIELKSQRSQVLTTQLKDLQLEYNSLVDRTKTSDQIDSTVKDDQYQYKDESQRRRVSSS